MPSTVIYEDNLVLAIKDIYPAAKTHVLVLPKEPYISFDDFTAKADAIKVAAFFNTVRKVAHILKLQDNGYRIVMNHGNDGGQVVPHFHVHILGGQILKGL